MSRATISPFSSESIGPSLPGRMGTPAFRIARGGLGYVPEDRRIFTDLTVYENLEIGRRQYVLLRRFIEQYLPQLRNPSLVGHVAQVLQARRRPH